jgi:hypothetical protein
MADNNTQNTQITVSFQCSPYEADLLITLYDSLRTSRSISSLVEPAGMTLETFPDLLTAILDITPEMVEELKSYLGPEACVERVALIIRALKSSLSRLESSEPDAAGAKRQD